ncbi:MAG: DNA translocase FtsK, partial [Clostridia bacterium]|nr:DNA translocase FtsK [Clostridia bacterium]
LRDNAEKLIDVLESFGVRTTLVDIARGPSVTRYELAPAAGVKLSKITGLADDIALNLAASGVRIAPIPGKTAVGIEVPNKDRDAVNLREVLESPEYKKGAQKSKLSVALGKDISGKICTMDIAKMPHLLIAGTTGSGKSVCVNAMILSILYNATPEEVKLVMIDPKKVEFSKYNGIPHLLVPVVTEPAKAAGSLQWAVREMLNRYQKFSDTGVRDIKGYNQVAAGDPDMEVMSQIVIFIDELADLMMATPKEVEDSICRLAQMARAAGMHMVIATQRPSVDVITGLIKANIPSRLSLYVASAVDSRTILDMTGAEKLLGNGDLLFNPVGVSKPTRIQGCFSEDKEIERVVTFIKNQEESEYDESIIKDIEAAAAATENANQKGGGVNAPSGGDSSDDLFEQAIQVVLEAGQASTSMLQRKLGVGYARAGRIIDELEEHGIIGEYQGSKPRAVLITKQQWLERNAMSGDADDGTAAAIELGLED